MKNKKAISEVITTILIILLVLVAIVIMWGVLQKFLDKAAGEVGSECITIGLRLKKAEYNLTDNTTSILVQRDEGKGTIESLKFLVYNDQGENIMRNPKETEFVNVLEAKRYTITDINFIPKKVEVAFSALTEAEEEKQCGVADKSENIKQVN